MWKLLGLLRILIMLLLLQYHVAVSLPSAPTSKHLSLSMQKVALFQFKLSLLIHTSASAACTSDRSYPKMMNWSMSSDCCMWKGVTCDPMKRNVFGLDLTCSHLEGVISPNSTLFQLSTLQFIYFDGNNLHGVLPDSIANLKSLTTLSLSDCNFSGPIPRTLGNLTKITYINLEFNHITGPIPYSLANIQSLEYIFLHNNSLTGQFPSWFNNFGHLVSLDLSDNLLSGHLPSNLTALNLTRLLALDLANNLLDGMIPSWLFDLPSLKYLYVDYNGFIGQLNEFNSSRSALEHFSCRENMLNGTIPQSFSKLVNLTHLNLADNQFGGEIPQWNGLILKGSSFYLNLSHNSLIGGIEHLPWDNLFILDLHSNMLNGSMPASISNSSSLCILNLSHNNLRGVLPSFPRNANQLKYLDLQSNMLNGFLPSFICNSSILHILNLSYNNFSGALPTCLGSVNYSLSVLDLRMNSIGGSLPSSLAFGKLRTLNLYGNKLEGTIPVSFAKFSYLEVLDIGSNHIRDTFPHCLESLPTLQVLVLKSNKFHGFISNDSKIERPFPSLRIIDLSYNEFSGLLPAKYIRNFSAMMNGDVHKVILGYMGYASYSDSIIVVIKGVEIELVRILTALTTIDLSQNKFEGEIPEYIGNLKSLRYLNLSHNYLTGHIPPLIGKLSVLESLDLSFNRLDGVIPQQLTNLFSLSHINLSQNNLSGRIPEGAQFHTFENDSYAGNLGLCGRPLSKKCIAEKREEEDDDDDDYFFSGLTWKAMLLGYGCGMVLGFVAGYLMFMAGKPKWLTKIVAREPGLIVSGMEIRRR
ncbi:receptor-like protein 33 [Daucus carota subsp. sativus]|uniref:receptor-like protein 33 n=1 Tax=Daucus carota subsp. sativus TaxID=79200 RepID=UPI0007EF7FE0|nr:PREDICTED: receptor like protein 30-like [Daucus carota subsp. sativus]